MTKARNSSITFSMLAACATIVMIITFGAEPIEASAGAGSNLATIKGVVRDQSGNPIADATVAIFRVGTAKLLKQVRSASDGSFIAKILPGKYTILAVAEGFNPVTLSEVQLNRASLASYGFKLERAGSGNTLPEKRTDRNNPKWLIRSGALSRSIYQNTEGDIDTGSADVEETLTIESSEETRKAAPSVSVAETFYGSSARGSFAGINYATLLPLAENADLVLAAQTGVGRNAPQRFESHLNLQPSNDHRIRLKAGYGHFGTVKIDDGERSLGQISLQATDEWRVREGIVLVYGFDYSKFVGAGGDFSLSPRVGFQYDLDAKTRLRSAFTTTTEERTWSRAIELEDAQVFFREPASISDVAVEDGKPVMNRSSRLEIGIERVLDNRSSLELNAFFDTTFARGMGFTALNLAGQNEQLNEFTGNQQGDSQGLRVVYSRRLSGTLSAGGGYSFGSGQRLSSAAISTPDSLFESDFFHTFFGRFDVDLASGTSVRTVFRLSPQATVFAIDPFQGRLAIYDPGLSVLVTQHLPTLGLPIRAEAIVDARNLFDFQTGVNGEEGSLRFNSFRRALRGSILVRF